MNIFEEHQLSIPIINDSRFAPKLKELRSKNWPSAFCNNVFKALRDIKTESQRIKIKIEQLDAHRMAIAALLDSRP